MMRLRHWPDCPGVDHCRCAESGSVVFEGVMDRSEADKLLGKMGSAHRMETTLTPAERAMMIQVIEAQYTGTLRAQLAVITDDADEQLQMAGAVLALMVRKMYLQRGEPWLEAILTMVLQPPDQVTET